MLKDFTIESTKDDILTTSDVAKDSLENNVYLSLTTKVGSYWFNPLFGDRTLSITKIVGDVEKKVDQFIREALNWLLIAGRISVINTTILVDREKGRITYSVTVTKANGIDTLTTEDFVIVI